MITTGKYAHQLPLRCAEYCIAQFAEIEGKKGGFMIYVGGFDRFKQLSEDAVAEGYKGFVRT